MPWKALCQVLYDIKINKKNALKTLDKCHTYVLGYLYQPNEREKIMGARVHFVFNDGTDSAVVLYSHWGADTWEHDLAEAIKYAEPRKGDTSYFTRMVISYLIKDELMSETGFGIYAMHPKQALATMFDETVEIDLVKETVNGYSFDSLMVWQGV